MAFKDNFRIEKIYFQRVKDDAQILASWKTDARRYSDEEITAIAKNACDSILMLYRLIGEAWNDALNHIEKLSAELEALASKAEAYHDELNEKIDDVNNYLNSEIKNIEAQIDAFGGLPSNANASEGDVLTVGAGGVNEWSSPAAGVEFVDLEYDTTNQTYKLTKNSVELSPSDLVTLLNNNAFIRVVSLDPAYLVPYLNGENGYKSPFRHAILAPQNATFWEGQTAADEEYDFTYRGELMFNGKIIQKLSVDVAVNTVEILSITARLCEFLPNEYFFMLPSSISGATKLEIGTSVQGPTLTHINEGYNYGIKSRVQMRWEGGCEELIVLNTSFTESAPASADVPTGYPTPYAFNLVIQCIEAFRLGDGNPIYEIHGYSAKVDGKLTDVYYVSVNLPNKITIPFVLDINAVSYPEVGQYNQLLDYTTTGPEYDMDNTEQFTQLSSDPLSTSIKLNKINTSDAGTNVTIAGLLFDRPIDSSNSILPQGVMIAPFEPKAILIYLEVPEGVDVDVYNGGTITIVFERAH